MNTIRGVVRRTDATEDSEDVSCQYHTPVSDELYEILTHNICDIFILCKDPLLSCNATQGGVNTLTRVSNLASCPHVQYVKSSAWLGACAGIAAALLRRFNQERG